MGREEECEGGSPQGGRRQTSICLLPCFKLDLAIFNHWCSFISFTIIPICVLCVQNLKNRRGADEDGKKRRGM